MNKEGARALAAALDVQGRALTIQGGMSRAIVAKWGGDSNHLSKLPAHAMWSQDHAVDVRRRLGILEGDPEYVLMTAVQLGLLSTWKDIEEKGHAFLKDAEEQLSDMNDSQEKADAFAVVKSLSVWKGIAAYRRIEKVWVAEEGMRTTRSLLELSERFREAYLNEKAIAATERAKIYGKPWSAATLLSKIGYKKFKPLSFLNKAPTKGIFNKAFLPLAITTGLKEMLLPSHQGALGAADRGMGLVQVLGATAVLYDTVGLAAAASSIPVVGWVALGVAGAYFLGTWAWDRWGDDIKAGTKKAWNWTKDKSGQAWQATKRKTSEAWRDTKKKTAETWKDTKKMAERIMPGPVKKVKFW